MITTSGGLIRKFTEREATYSPVERVEYYDTPYSVPSWGFKKVTYDNTLVYSGDGNFHTEEIIDTARDPIIAHAWGATGPPVMGGKQHYLIRWYGYMYAEYTGLHKFYCTADDGVRFHIATADNGGRLNFVPETLGSAQALDLNPVDPNESTSSWAIRDHMTAYSGWANLVEGEWYPVKIEYGQLGGAGIGQRGDILVQYTEPEAADIIAYGDSSWHYNENDAADEATFFETSFSEDIDWARAAAPYGTNSAVTTCAILSDIVTAWTINTNLMLRRSFSLTASQVTEDLKLKFALQDSVDLYFNGQHLGHFEHPGGCPVYDQYEVVVPKSILVVGSNLLAALVVSSSPLGGTGSSCFFDARLSFPPVVNSSGDKSRPDKKKVLSAGVVNYPFGEVWSDGDDASFVGTTTSGSYLELPDVISIKGDRALGNVGKYEIVLPMDNDKYKPIKNLKAHYRHVDTGVVIRPGRLIDISAGFQTACRHYVPASETCSLGLTAWSSGGYLEPNLCSTVNQNCPFQQAMPGDYVKRFRGRITGIDVSRDKDGSKLVLTCEDNLHYLQTAIARNYPDHVSYAAFGYTDRVSSPDSPDGLGRPEAYDGFLMNEAVEDICIKAGVDPTYLYSRQDILRSGLTYDKGDPLIRGERVRLTKPTRYGNPTFFGDADDLRSDEKYLWKQGYGEPMIDMVASLSDNYGYFFTCDPNGNIVFNTRQSPSFKMASSPEWNVPSTWQRIIDKNTVGGSYLHANDSIDHASITVDGNSFDLYMALQKPIGISGWNILYNEGVIVSGFDHADFDMSQVLETGVDTGGLQFIGVEPYSVGAVDDGTTFGAKPLVYKGAESWLVISSMYDFNCDRIDLTIHNAYDNVTPGLFSRVAAASDGGVLSYALDVEMGSSFGLDFKYAGQPNYIAPRYTAAATKVVSDQDIGWLFDVVGPARISIPFDSGFALTSGTQIAVKFTTKLMLDGSEFTPELQLEKAINTPVSPVFYTEWIGPYPVISVGAKPSCTKISWGAYPNYPAVPVRYMAWDNWTRHTYHQAIKAVMPGSVGSWTWRDYNDLPGFSYTDNDGISPIDIYPWHSYNLYMDMSFEDSSTVPSGWFGVRVVDDEGVEVFNRRFSNNSLVPTNKTYRYSTLGVDPLLGYNPSIFTLRGGAISADIGGTFVKPDATEYTIYVSGHQARVEAMAVYEKDPYSAKMRFSTQTNMYSLDVKQPTSEIRNDVVVVGRLKGPVVDPNTGYTINPNNPTLSYVYSRAIDLGSIEHLDTDNSIGKQETFVIHEPSIANQEHADWLARNVLERYRKIQNQVGMRSLAVPYLDIEDSIFVTDPISQVTGADDRYWIEGISETITAGKYDMDLALTPLAPWPSFEPTPPLDIRDFKAYDTGNPQVIIDIQMIDQATEDSRNPDSGNATNSYDPYESDGSSALYNIGLPNNLVLKYRQLVNGEVNVRIMSVEKNDVVAYLVGGDDGTDTGLIYQQMAVGEYEWEWDGIDKTGQSRDPGDASFENIIVPADNNNNFPGIFSKDGKYYVIIECKSFQDSDHTVLGAPTKYSTKSVATLHEDGVTELSNPGLGEVTNAYRHALYWDLAVGAASKVKLAFSPDVNGHPYGVPGTGAITSKLLAFTSKDNAGVAGGTKMGLHTWLEPNDTLTGNEAIAMANRRMKTVADIYYHAAFVFPVVDTFEISSTNYWCVEYPDDNQLANWNMITHNGPGGDPRDRVQYSVERSLPDAVITNDGLSEQGGDGPAETRIDENKINNCVVLRNTPRKQIAQPIKRDDQWYLVSSDESKIVLNPRDFGHRYDTVPTAVAQWWANIVNTSAGTPLVYLVTDGGPVNTPVLVGYAGFKKCFATKWYTLAYTMYDKSGRAPNIQQTYDHRVGIGLCNTPNSNFENKVTVRAYWLPLGTYDSYGGNLQGFEPDFNDLDRATPGAANYSCKKYSLPSPGTEYNGDSITSYAIPCIVVDNDPNYYIKFGAPMTDAMSLASYGSSYGVYSVYAYPFHTFWKQPNNKAAWTTDLSGAEVNGFLSDRINTAED